MDLRPGSGVRVDDSPQLLGGEALAIAAGRLFTVELGSAQAVVRSHGAARLARGLAATAGAYRRDVVLRSAGREVDVRGLRQAASPALGFVDEPIPLRVDAADPWDRRFLGEAIDVGHQLQSLVAPFDSSLRSGEGHTPGFFRVALPALERERAFDGSRLDPERPPAETLIGAAIAVSSPRRSFPDRWSGTFSFRDQGADWGLVALDQEVASLTALLNMVNSAFGRSPLVFPGPATGAAAGQLALGGGTGGAGGGAAAGPGAQGASPAEAGDRGSNPGSGAGANPPPSGPLPQPGTGTPADPILTPVVNQVNQVLQPVVPGPGPSPTSTLPPLPAPTLPPLPGGASTSGLSTTSTLPLRLP
jgi:hypothetical protein